MWTRMLLQPWWVRGLAVAGVFAVLGIVSWCANWMAGDAKWPGLPAFAGQVVGFAIFSLLVAACTGSSHRAFTYSLAGLDPAQRSATVHASFGGAVPVDARVRDAAIRVTERRLRLARFWRVIWLIPVGSYVLSLVIWMLRSQVRFWSQASGFSAGDWFTFAVVLCFTVAAWHAAISAKHRLQTLRQTQIQSPFGTATSFVPGWYPDPHDGNLMRYFDGRMWTSSTRPSH